MMDGILREIYFRVGNCDVCSRGDTAMVGMKINDCLPCHLVASSHPAIG